MGPAQCGAELEPTDGLDKPQICERRDTMHPATTSIALTSLRQLNPVCLADVATRTWPGFEAPAPANDDDVHAPPKPKDLPLAWPDKTALVIAALIAALCVVVWTTTLASSGFVLYGRLDHTLALWAAAAELGVALPLWLVLRVADDIGGGPKCRRDVSHARRIEPWFETDPAPMPGE